MNARVFLFIVGVLTAAVRCMAAEPTVLGVVYRDEPVSFDLTLVNRGGTAMTLGEIKASCDCLTFATLPSQVAAGATVKIPCVYRSAKTGVVAVDVVVMDAAGSAPVAMFSVTGFVADQAWLRSPVEVAGRAGERVVVDTRSSARFAAVHIPRALNVPAFALKTRTELKTREVILVDEGFEPAALLAEVQALRALGFARVQVLDGGMAAWLRHDLPVEGTDASSKAVAVAEITPAEFIRARHGGVWQAVGVGALPGGKLESLFPAGIEYAKLPEDVGSRIASLPISRANGLRARVLVIAAADSLAMGVESRLANATDAPVFYLRGGLAALHSYQAGQAALAVNTGQLSQTKTSRRSPVVSGACGSCGK